MNQIYINELISNCHFNDNDSDVLSDAIIGNDYNLMRIIVEDNISEVRNLIDENLLQDNTKNIKKLLECYKYLLKLNNLIMSKL